METLRGSTSLPFASSHSARAAIVRRPSCVRRQKGQSETCRRTRTDRSISAIGERRNSKRWRRTGAAGSTLRLGCIGAITNRVADSGIFTSGDSTLVYKCSFSPSSISGQRTITSSTCTQLCKCLSKYSSGNESLKTSLSQT